MKIVDRDWVHRNIDSFRSQKCVVITGAGISCPSGIPDYRSKEGLFNARGKKGLRGSDYFDYRFSMQPETRPEYLRFIALFKDVCDNASPSDAHQVLNYLKTVNRLRVYSQNICGLEERAGLVAERSLKTELVLLHGDMKTLKCTYCGYRAPFTSAEREKFGRSEDMVCPKCLSRQGRRCAPKGIMNTTIVHYNQPHPDSYLIGDISESDKNLTLLIVVGTSMKVHGVKRLARHFLRNLNGVSLFVNLEEPNSEFQKSFQYMWKGDCNEFFKVLKEGLETNKPLNRAQKISASIKVVAKDVKQGGAGKSRARKEPAVGKEAKKSATAVPEATLSGGAHKKEREAKYTHGIAMSGHSLISKKPPEELSARETKGAVQGGGKRKGGGKERESADDGASPRTLYSRYLSWLKIPPTGNAGESRDGAAYAKGAILLNKAVPAKLQKDTKEKETHTVTQDIKMSEIELLIKDKISKTTGTRLATRARRNTICSEILDRTPIEKGWRRFSLASSIGSYFSVKPRKN